MVKVDVEGFDVAALHGLRRLLMEDERPVAVTLEFTPRMTPHTPVPCDAVAFTRFMYDQGYVYEDVVDVEDMVATVISDASTGDAHEGWWRLHGAFPTTAQPAASTTSDLPSTSASGDSRGDDSKNDAAVESLVGVSSPQFCRGNAALEGAVGSSQFNEVVGDGVRAAAANPDAATSNATLSSFVDSLSTQAPCFWARYTALPLPDGMNMSLCTHDPAVDTVMSAKIHTAGSWFEDSVWSDFGRMLVDGSCPPDRPVVLDLGLNIGYEVL
jgi:hypothetical protein